MMSYEKEIAELWKEWKKSTKKYEEAIEDGYDVDADMWAKDVETIHRQIHLYEKAAKVDEYEKNKHRTHVNDCKAEAFDAILKAYDEAFSREHMADEVCNIIQKYESGEQDE